MWYGNNSHCDGKAFLDSVFKLHREENCNATWSLQISGMIKSKSQLWKAVVVNCDQGLAQMGTKVQMQYITMQETLDLQ